MKALLLIGSLALSLPAHASFLTCAQALEEYGFPGGPHEGRPTTNLRNRSFIPGDSEEFGLGKGTRAWTYRVNPAWEGDSYVLKHYTPRASAHREFSFSAAERDANRLQWLKSDVQGYRFFKGLLPNEGTVEQFASVALLEVNEANFYLKLSNNRGQVLGTVAKRLGNDHPVTHRLSELYIHRLSSLDRMLRLQPEVTEIDLRDENGLFPELSFRHRKARFIVIPQAVLVNTQTDLMTIFDPS